MAGDWLPISTYLKGLPVLCSCKEGRNKLHWRKMYYFSSTLHDNPNCSFIIKETAFFNQSFFHHNCSMDHYSFYKVTLLSQSQRKNHLREPNTKYENLTVRNKTLQHSNTEIHQLFITDPRHVQLLT